MEAETVRATVPQWYAMRATYRRENEAVRLLEAEGMQCFIPLQYQFRVRHGRKVRELVPVVHNLLFVYACSADIQRVKAQMPYLQYITDTRSHEKIIVPEEQMRRFIAVAGTYSDQLLYFAPGELNLKKGVAATAVILVLGILLGVEMRLVLENGVEVSRIWYSLSGLLMLLMVLVILYLFPVMSRFDMKLSRLCMLAFKEIFTK